MFTFRRKWAVALAIGLTVGLCTSLPAGAQTPKRGGILKYVVPAEPPSYDGHRETTFALIHPIAPFYSVLIRVNPDNPASTTDFVCDLCTPAHRQGRPRDLPEDHLSGQECPERAKGLLRHGRLGDRAG